MSAPPAGENRVRPRALDAAAVIAAMTFPAAASWVYFSAAAGTGWIRVLYPASKVIQFGFPVLWIFLIRRRPAQPRPAGGRGIGAGLITGVLIAASIAVAYFGYFKGSAVLGEMPARIGAKVEDIGAATPARYFALAAFIALLHSFLEEYYWRWFVYGELRRWMGFPIAILVSSLAFTAHHVIILDAFVPREHFWANLLFSAAVGAGGAVWAWLYHRTGSLLAPWVSHVLADAAVLAIGCDLLRGVLW